MRGGASTPDSKPVTEALRGVLDAVSPNVLREIVIAITMGKLGFAPGEQVLGREKPWNRKPASGFSSSPLSDRAHPSRQGIHQAASCYHQQLVWWACGRLRREQESAVHGDPHRADDHRCHKGYPRRLPCPHSATACAPSTRRETIAEGGRFMLAEDCRRSLSRFPQANGGTTRAASGMAREGSPVLRSPARTISIPFATKMPPQASWDDQLYQVAFRLESLIRMAVARHLKWIPTQPVLAPLSGEGAKGIASRGSTCSLSVCCRLLAWHAPS